MTESEAIAVLKMIETHGSLPQKAKHMAIQALKKQIPKKPVEYEDKFYGCPVCANPVMHKWKKYNTELMPKTNGLPYCLNCGQALDWSDTGAGSKLCGTCHYFEDGVCCNPNSVNRADFVREDSSCEEWTASC